MRTVIRSNSIASRRGFYYGFMARFYAGYFCCEKCIKPSVYQSSFVPFPIYSEKAALFSDRAASFYKTNNQTY